MRLLGDYEKAKQALYDHVGFTEDWVVYAIEDRTDFFWSLTIDERFVRFALSEEDLDEGWSKCYEYEIYKQRFYPKWVYIGEDLTMCICDTHIDGNKFFVFFSNKKRIGE